jgi:hypothetical protein
VQSHRLFGLAPPPPLARISLTASGHAGATFRHAGKPYWIRRIACVADQLRLSFGRETLASKYGIPAAQISLLHAVKNLADLMRRHRGNMLQRLTGYGMQL